MKTIQLTPSCKDYLWGGEKLRTEYGIQSELHPLSEAWMLSCHPDGPSYLPDGSTFQQYINTHPGCLGTHCEKFSEFPVLAKLIDAKKDLSIQVHPSNEYALEHEHQYGKTEMWYVLDCEPGAYLYVGFNRPVTRDEYLRAVSEGTLTDLLMRYEVRKGDAYYIPAGTVHAIGPGLLIAEIQETSDITYRISDWGRLGRDGKPRQLHTAEATDAIDFNYGKEYFRPAVAAPGSVKEIVSTPFFTTNVIEVDGEVRRDYASLDSFVAYICTDGALRADTDGGSEKLAALESLLLPAEIDEAVLSGKGTLLEVYMV